MISIFAGGGEGGYFATVCALFIGGPPACRVKMLNMLNMRDMGGGEATMVTHTPHPHTLQFISHDMLMV